MFEYSFHLYLISIYLKKGGKKGGHNTHSPIFADCDRAAEKGVRRKKGGKEGSEREERGKGGKG
ncbi:MAG: hypothetical protein ACPLRA_03380, partial [Candidatus Saccharicenans sp.]